MAPFSNRWIRTHYLGSVCASASLNVAADPSLHKRHSLDISNTNTQFLILSLNRSFQQFTLPHQQMAMATALSPSMTSVPSPPQSQQHSILASMLTQHSLHNQSPSSPSHSTSPSSMHNPNIIYTDSSSTEPEFVQLSIPEVSRKMKALHFGKTSEYEYLLGVFLC